MQKQRDMLKEPQASDRWAESIKPRVYALYENQRGPSFRCGHLTVDWPGTSTLCCAHLWSEEPVRETKMVPGANKGILNRCYNLESSVFQLSDELVPVDSLTRVGGRISHPFPFKSHPIYHTCSPSLSYFSNQHSYPCFFVTYPVWLLHKSCEGEASHLTLLRLCPLPLTQIKCAVVF